MSIFSVNDLKINPKELAFIFSMIHEDKSTFYSLFFNLGNTWPQKFSKIKVA